MCDWRPSWSTLCVARPARIRDGSPPVSVGKHWASGALWGSSSSMSAAGLAGTAWHACATVALAVA
eukprot:scaffold4656_cov117-Isochrysis_galbana.AAC.12